MRRKVDNLYGQSLQNAATHNKTKYVTLLLDGSVPLKKKKKKFTETSDVVHD